MQDWIIGFVLLIAVLFGVRETVKHVRGQGGCCGGAADKLPKKKLKNPVVRTYVFRIEGMHCRNCANAVTIAVNDIPGASAAVSLWRKRARVLCDREIDAQAIIDAVEKRGYHAERIR